jgi:DNA primase
MDDDAFRGEVIFTFDGDAAGQKAALRAFTDDQKFVAQTFVAVEPNGKDPCELRQDSGDAAVRDLIARRVPLFEFAIKSAIAQYDLATPEGRVSALNVAAPLIGKIRDTSLRPEYARSLAGWLGMEVEIVSTAVKRGISNVARTENIEVETAQAWRPDPSEPRLILEREVLKARLQMPALCRGWKDIEGSAFTHPAYQKLRDFILTQPEYESVSIDRAESEDLRSFITELTVEPIRTDGEVSDRYVSSIIARLREVTISRAIAEIKSTLQRINPVENEAEYNRMFGDLVAMETTRRSQHELGLGEI